MVHHFDHRWASYDGAECEDVSLSNKMNPSFEITPRYWAAGGEVLDQLRDKQWQHGWLMGWRDITNATNERTVVASIFPLSAVGNNLPLMFFGSPAPPPNLIAALCANLESLTLDFFARQKVGGTHLNFFIYQQLPILPPSAYGKVGAAFVVPRVLELVYTSYAMAPFARDLGYNGPPYTWDEDRRALLRADIDAWYALAYGLSRDEIRYVLDPKEAKGADYPSESFRGLQKNEISEYGEYRTARLVLAAYDRLVSEGMRPRTEGYR